MGNWLSEYSVRKRKVPPGSGAPYARDLPTVPECLSAVSAYLLTHVSVPIILNITSTLLASTFQRVRLEERADSLQLAAGRVALNSVQYTETNHSNPTRGTSKSGRVCLPIIIARNNLSQRQSTVHNPQSPAIPISVTFHHRPEHHH